MMWPGSGRSHPELAKNAVEYTVHLLLPLLELTRTGEGFPTSSLPVAGDDHEPKPVAAAARLPSKFGPSGDDVPTLECNGTCFLISMALNPTKPA